MNALKKFPDVRALSPYHPRILYIHAKFILAFLSLATTTGQSSSVAVRMRPRYLTVATLVRGWKNSRNTASVPDRSSSVDNPVDLALLSLVALMAAVKGLPQYHNVISGAARVGEGVLLHDNHGVPHVVVHEVHHNTRPVHYPYFITFHRKCQRSCCPQEL